MFRNKTLDLQQKFDTDDEVVIRFRLFSDPFAAGWGWCIDNLKIQIDETPPVVLNDHVDYLVEGATVLSIETSATDVNGVESLKIEFKVNDGALNEYEFDLEFPSTTYTLSISLEGEAPFSLGDLIEYRIIATDPSNNIGTFPPSDGFIKVPVINFSTPVATYINNFNSSTTDFVGNFFSVTQPSGFTNGAVHSTHSYPLGIGLDLTSNFTYILTKPITIGNSNTYLRFDEIALVQGHTSGVVFGSPAFNDYVIVEGSKDDGETWSQFADGYDAVWQSAWLAAFNSQLPGTPALYRTRSIDMTGNGNFSSGEDVIIRFRLFSNATINGWGWAIDNLYIQDAITGTEKELETAVNIYPNPVREAIFVEVEGVSSPHFNIQLMNTQGQHLYQSVDEAVNGKLSHSIPASTLPKGLYLVKVSNEGSTVIRKVIKME
jgi:hypothetical protein